MQTLRRYAPELGLLLIALFFTYRDLGIFPRSWLDEGLFVMTAKTVAFGDGYATPLLDHLWRYPYFLAVGPTVILPSALFIKLFGLSIAVARIPMTFYILATLGLTYVFTRRIAGPTAARWTMALMISLSAFINTGKPVLGEVPAFFFLIGGFAAMEFSIKKNSGLSTIARSTTAGILFGLSVMTKLTYGIILPALGVAWLWNLFKKRWSAVGMLTWSGVLAVIVYLPWRILEQLNTPYGSYVAEIGESIFGTGDLPLFYVVRFNNQILFDLPFLAFTLMMITGFAGLWSHRITLSQSAKITITTSVVLFLLYYLTSYGWYRHLLPAHLLLLPFVPTGMMRILGRRFAYGALAAIVLAQGVWQLQYRGSGLGTKLAETVEIIKTEYAETNILIQEAEIFAQLPENPRWLYLIPNNVSPTMPEIYFTPGEQYRCYAHVRSVSEEDRVQLGNRARPIGGYFVIAPPVGCR